jgi:hypothetical protein
MKPALEATAAVELTPGASLAQAQNRDGGWGAYAGGPSTTEATSLAVLAGESIGDAERSAAGLSWLLDRQRPDGAWPMSDAVPQASWMTPLATLALARFEEARPRAIRAGHWLLGQEGSGLPWIARAVLWLFPKRRAIEVDSELKGWAWYPDTFSWVEPTAYALMALQALRPDLPRGPTEARIREGERMILDRMCSGGGWNYGNSRVLGEELWPYPDTTALALMAMHDQAERKEIRRSLDVLDELVAVNDSSLVLSLAVLCRRLYGLETTPLKTRLMEKLRVVGPRAGTRSLALATLALHGTHGLVAPAGGPTPPAGGPTAPTRRAAP